VVDGSFGLQASSYFLLSSRVHAWAHAGIPFGKNSLGDETHAVGIASSFLCSQAESMLDHTLVNVKPLGGYSEVKCIGYEIGRYRNIV
jgi:hypothetical protein